MNSSRLPKDVPEPRFVDEAIRRATAVLPGRSASVENEDPRWEAIIEVGHYIESNPEEVWQFISTWGGHSQEDIRNAIACVLLEHLLEFHFDLIFPRVEAAVESNVLFSDMFCRCWRFGQSELPTNAIKFDTLQEQCRNTINRHDADGLVVLRRADSASAYTGESPNKTAPASVVMLG